MPEASHSPNDPANEPTLKTESSQKREATGSKPGSTSRPLTPPPGGAFKPGHDTDITLPTEKLEKTTKSIPTSSPPPSAPPGTTPPSRPLPIRVSKVVEAPTNPPSNPPSTPQSNPPSNPASSPSQTPSKPPSSVPGSSLGSAATKSCIHQMTDLIAQMPVNVTNLSWAKGDRVGEFELETALGKGGYGEVWRAMELQSKTGGRASKR